MITKTELENNIRELREQLEQEKKNDEYHRQAREVYSIYQSYVAAGFTEEQAWEIIITHINNIKK